MLLLALFAPVAGAVPMELSHQGRLLDATGDPLEGMHVVDAALFADPTGGTALWTDHFSLSLSGGYFSIVLGSGAALDAELFDGDPLYLSLGVDGGTPLAQRVAIHSVPYAILAQSVIGGEVDVTTARVDGTLEAGSLVVDGVEVVDGSGRISFDRLVDVPIDADTLADLACAADQVPMWSGSAWTCAAHAPSTLDVGALSGTISVANLPIGTGAGTVAAGSHTHAFGEISGTVAIGQLPVGTGSTQVARGDHAHAFSAITGTATIGQLPVGTGATQVARGDHTHAFSQITGTVARSQLPALSAADVGAMPAGGPVQIGDAGPDCDADRVGTLSYADGALALCTEQGWTALAASPDGSTSGRAADSCFTLHRDRPDLQDGLYWVEPGSSGPLRVRCDMSRNGGGWTRVYYQDSRSGFFTTGQTVANRADPDAAVYGVLDELEGFRRDGALELMLRWPGDPTWTQPQWWSQTSNPVTAAVGANPTGYVSISTPYSANGWGGLQRSVTTTTSLLDGTLSPAANWYYAVGTTYCWGSPASGCQPAPDGGTHVVELWVR